MSGQANRDEKLYSGNHVSLYLILLHPVSTHYIIFHHIITQL
jgi:hypothetical protein